MGCVVLECVVCPRISCACVRHGYTSKRRITGRLSCTVLTVRGIRFSLHGRPSDRRHCLQPPCTPKVKVALWDMKSKMPLQKLLEGAAILVWPPVALFDTLVSERRFGSPSSSPSRPPVAGSSRTVLLIAVPPSCRLCFCPLCFQAP